jgi:tRNA(fMet)-specific endonuclease VapC
MLLTNELIVLPFDQAAASWFTKERARLEVLGKTCVYTDGEIAAIPLPKI